MFGQMNAIPIADLHHASEEVGGSVDGAIAKLLDVTERPRIAKWVQFPKALFVFLIAPADPESGAFYIYDRRARVWFWLDFDDEKFGAMRSAISTAWYGSADSWTSLNILNCSQVKDTGSSNQVFRLSRAAKLRKRG